MTDLALKPQQHQQEVGWTERWWHWCLSSWLSFSVVFERAKVS